MPFNHEESLLTAHKTVAGTVTIHFTDGTTQCFEFDVPEIDPRTSASKMQEVLVRKQLLIHLPDRVLVIPMPNIKCMEFKPVPRLPTDFSGFMIRNARLISATQNET